MRRLNSPIHTGRSGKGWLMAIAALVVGGVLLAAVAGAAIFFLVSGQKKQMTSEERALLIDVSDLAEWVEGFTPESDRESYTKITYFDRSYDLEYEYDPVSMENDLYVNCSITVEPGLDDAMISYSSLWAGANLGVWLEEGVELRENSSFYSYGDASKFATFYSDDSPFGNVFISRKGSIIFFVMFSGVYFTDPELFAEFIEPKLKRVFSAL